MLVSRQEKKMPGGQRSLFFLFFARDLNVIRFVTDRIVRTFSFLESCSRRVRCANACFQRGRDVLALSPPPLR
jgi:hypothetical protein